MDIKTLLEGVDCSCGRRHVCDIGHVVIGQGAISSLEKITGRYASILLVADENTYEAAGEKTEKALEGKKLKRVIFPGESILIPDEQAIQKITDALTGVELIIGIGSGVIQDLCKYVSHFNDIPYYIVATAPSMDGYASTGAAMILGGMKVTVSAGVPAAIIADTDVLKEAPMEMILAGYGDIVGKYSALNDWKLSRVINEEYFCQEIYDLTFHMVHKTIEISDGLLLRREESVRTLMEALVIVGIAMSFAGSSRPASGSEHHLSHFFEITGIVHKQAYFPHGVDVAYSTVVTAWLREELLKRPWPETQYRPEREEYLAQLSRIYGPVAQECAKLQDKVGLYEKDMLSVYRQKEAQIRQVLAEMPSAERIRQLLEKVGLHMYCFRSMYSDDKIRDAISYAKELKDRYTVLWMYYDLFGGQ